MTHYTDLSPYAYTEGSIPDGIVAVSVGWLEPGEEFPRGTVPEEFVRSLALLCRDDRHMVMRGWHRCGLPHPGGADEYPVVIQVGEDRVSLGSAEVRVVGRDGRWLVAPNLVYHYVTAHSYLPPTAFIEAVTARRTAAPPA
ncbi:hypothetical protein [Streptomyces sp. ME19-01-6]|uniref:DUF7919 family protein n=1 Tax=Streptomyces sp. ME19-01-6 TaxID=3028686 RepID=UPI0029AE88ED|nr:hypothetical protein [Streptomyces sp. ME19-01-6]MDX3229028.1 hypothetical protein [Streptomyces sp. ME19-01-6]